MNEMELHREFRNEERLIGYGCWCFEKGQEDALKVLHPSEKSLRDAMLRQGKIDERSETIKLLKDIEANKFYCKQTYCPGLSCGKCAIDFVLSRLEAKDGCD